MSNNKKIPYSSRCSICSIILGCLIAFYSVLIFKSFVYSILYLSILTTLSVLNIVNINRKNIYFAFNFSSSDDVNGKEKTQNKRIENKEFTFMTAFVLLFCGVFVYAVIAILFGAPLSEVFSATLYFSSLMTLLTVYPLILYYFFSDNAVTVLKIITESKFDSMIDIHFRSVLIWTAVGAWLGAFPIPLDWDRPWQKWPITCCIGASLGNSAVHFSTGFKLIYSYFRDRRKVFLNRSV